MSGEAGDEGIKNPLRLDRPVKVTVSITTRCNLECLHCYADCGRTGANRELTAAEWMSFIDERIEEGVISLFLEGGEPFCRPDFLDILRHASRRVMLRVRTNGTLIDEALAAELKRIGIGTVLVDVMGATAGTHDGMTGVPGSHALAVRGVQHLLAAKVPTQMLLILNRHNAGELQAWCDYAFDLGVRTVGILRLYPIGRPKRRWRELALSLDEMMRAIEGLRPPEGLKVMQSWHPQNANCCWQMAAVDPTGRSIGCTYLRELVDYGNVLTTPFLETWDHPLYRELRSGAVETACGACSENESSHGGCRSTAFAFHGRWTAPDPFDVVLNQGVDLRELPRRMLQDRPGPARTRATRAGNRDRVRSR